MTQLDERQLEAIQEMRSMMVAVIAMLNESIVNYDRAMADREVTSETWQIGDHGTSEVEAD